MKIHTYAVLKDYFDKEFTIDERVGTVEGLHNFLAQRNPAAVTILAASRYAVKDNFVGDDFVLNTEDTIHIMPPSSGG
ncbi:MAG TPA: MoaD/ThiS family protein [Ferruginibacter sp.]|nr:MoaD/ThiS family protein [Ferruginibacter sp.]HPH89945.1 MoaD/ThiS family protein [Ferruginibacter sp.]